MRKLFNNDFNSYLEEMKNVKINKKKALFHNIKKEELILMYKNFYEINNLSSQEIWNEEVDNSSFALYESWLVRFNDY